MRVLDGCSDELVVFALELALKVPVAVGVDARQANAAGSTNPLLSFFLNATSRLDQHAVTKLEEDLDDPRGFILVVYIDSHMLPRPAKVHSDEERLLCKHGFRHLDCEHR